MQRHGLQAQRAGQRQRLQRQRAAPLEGRIRHRRRAPHPPARARGQLRRRLPAQRRQQARALQRHVVQRHLQPVEVDLHVVLRLRVGPAEAAVADLQRAQVEAPGRGGLGGRGRRRRGRGPGGGVQRAPLVAGQARLRALQPDGAQAHLAGGQVHRRLRHLQPVEREQRRCAGGRVAPDQARPLHRRLRQRDREPPGRPFDRALQRQRALQPRPQHAGQIGLGRGQRQILHADVQPGRGVARLAPHRDPASGRRRQRRRGAHRHRRLHRPGHRPGGQIQPVEAQACGRPRRRVLPGHARPAQRHPVDRHRPGGGSGRGGRGGRGGRRRRGRGIGLRGGRPDAPLRIARHHQVQPVERHRAERDPARQRLHLAQRDLQRRPADRAPALPVGQRQVARADPAGERHRGRPPFRRLEGERQVGAQPALQRAQRQRLRPVAEPGGQVQVGQAELRAGVPPGREGAALRLRVEGGAVEREGEPGRDLGGQVGGQVGEEGQGEGQLLHLVHAAERPVVEAHPAVAHLQVVQREAGRLGVGRGRIGGAQPGDQVVDVVMAVGGARQVQRRALHRQRGQHRRAVPQRTQVRVRMHPRHLEQRGRRRVRAGRRADAQPLHRQLQRPRPEVDARGRDRPAQRLARRARQQPAQQRRRAQPGGQPQRQEGRQGRAESFQPDVHVGVLGSERSGSLESLDIVVGFEAGIVRPFRLNGRGPRTADLAGTVKGATRPAAGRGKTPRGPGDLTPVPRLTTMRPTLRGAPGRRRPAGRRGPAC